MTGTRESRRNLITSIYLEPDQLEQHVAQAGSQVPGKRSDAKRGPNTGARRMRKSCWWAMASWRVF